MLFTDEVYVPAAHDEQPLAPVTDEKVPAVQLRHEPTVAPVRALKKPAAHALHAEALDAPTVLLYSPTPQAVQADKELAPVNVRYRPGGQVPQPYTLVASLYVPAAQLVHAEAPVTVE